MEHTNKLPGQNKHAIERSVIIKAAQNKLRSLYDILSNVPTHIFAIYFGTTITMMQVLGTIYILKYLIL